MARKSKKTVEPVKETRILYKVEIQAKGAGNTWKSVGDLIRGLNVALEIAAALIDKGNAVKIKPVTALVTTVFQKK